MVGPMTGREVRIPQSLTDLQNNHVLLKINKVRYIVDGSSGAAITGGPLGDIPYRLGEFQLHWGSKEGQGSEHEIDGER